MERSTCFTKVADCFGWFPVLTVFLFSPLYNGLFQKKKMGDVVGDILLFFVKPPEISRYITLPSAIPDKTRLHSWNFCNVELC